VSRQTASTHCSLRSLACILMYRWVICFHSRETTCGR